MQTSCLIWGFKRRIEEWLKLMSKVNHNIKNCTNAITAVSIRREFYFSKDFPTNRYFSMPVYRGCHREHKFSFLRKTLFSMERGYNLHYHRNTGAANTVQAGL